MSELSLGRVIQEQLCEECRERLRQAISKQDVILGAAHPQSLIDKVKSHCCDRCRLLIYQQALLYARRKQ